MVVGCRAQQLLKNGKNVSASFTTCVSMYSTAGFKYKNYVKSAIQNGIATDRFVRLYCDCRRAYSTDYQWPNEIKAGFTKLTAQETVLLSCIPAIFGEEVDASSPDVVESIIQDINVHVGQELLVISNGTVHLDTNALRISLTKWINRVIQDNYKGSPLVLFPLKTAANLQITLKTQQLQNLIGDKGISLSSLRSALPHGRSKRSIPSAIATIAKNIFKLILGFVNTKINTTLLNVSNDLMTLFITDESTHPLLGPAVRLSNDIVTQLAHFVLHIRSGINHAFDTVINGRNETDEAGSSPVDELEDSNSTSARAKRELDEFWLGDVVDTVSLREESDVSHNRKRRDLSTIIGEIIVVIRKVAFKLTSLLNASLKEYITTRLNKTYYGLIGKSLLSPVVKACNVIINVIFPCSTCTSLG